MPQADTHSRSLWAEENSSHSSRRQMTTGTAMAANRRGNPIEGEDAPGVGFPHGARSIAEPRAFDCTAKLL